MRHPGFWLLPLLVMLSACAGAPPRPPMTGTAPIRFVLTFDDGPGAAVRDNPTASILDTLARNPVQADIKALFFVQTWSAERPVVHALLQREHAEGHALGFHTATQTHANHSFLAPAELDASLQQGSAAIAAITGAAPTLVRPPFWSYDQRTWDAYRAHSMRMLLTDLSANDGKIWGIKLSPRRRSSLRAQLGTVRERIEAGALPVVDGVIPVVVTFHDINTYTAAHLPEYLRILVECAAEEGLPTAPQPFYGARDALRRAATARTVTDLAAPVALPGLWSWFWQ